MGLKTLSQPAFFSSFFFLLFSCSAVAVTVFVICVPRLASSWMRRDDNETHRGKSDKATSDAATKPQQLFGFPKKSFHRARKSPLLCLQWQNDASNKSCKSAGREPHKRKSEGESERVANWSKTNTNKMAMGLCSTSTPFPLCWRSSCGASFMRCFFLRLSALLLLLGRSLLWAREGEDGEHRGCLLAVFLF